MNKVSYALGIGIGRQLAQMGAAELNIDDFAQAIKDVIAGEKLKVSDTEAQTIVQNSSPNKRRNNVPLLPSSTRKQKQPERNI